MAPAMPAADAIAPSSMMNRNGWPARYEMTKTLEKVRTEMSLHALAFNLKRMIQILGVKPLMRAIQA